MAPAPCDRYDPRYLAGICFFNQGDYFEAHEVWEDLWAQAVGPERRHYQGLIQAAVCLHHFGNGNLRGARKLYQSGRAYMEPLDAPLLGLDKTAFWRQMERCLGAVLGDAEPDPRLRPDAGALPTITLDPPPDAWPDLAEYGEEEAE